jgi:hypothetical protein
MFLKILYLKFLDLISVSKLESNNKEENTTIKSNNYIDILLSLTEEFNIDLIIYINDKPTKIHLSELEYGMVCAEFINSCFTETIKQKLLSIINKDIKNKDNENLIRIVNMACSVSTKPIEDDTFIKPTQVFATNNHV